MSSGSYCHITIPADPKAWIKIEMGFNPNFLEIIKTIPYYQRHYNPTELSWTIAPEYQDYITRKAQEYFKRVIIISSGRAIEYEGGARDASEVKKSVGTEKS